MSWIKTISYTQAKGRLKTLYDRVKGPDDNIDNIMLAHSLRPHTMEGHMALYKNVLHHGGNTVPKWLLETIGVWVSLINNCTYCADHHFAGLQRLLADDKRSTLIFNALSSANIDSAPLTPAEKVALDYAEKLTRGPNQIEHDTIENLRRHGFDDGQILELNQVTAYFSYANRMVLGLGVSTDGDILGLSPGSDQTDDWSHG